MRRTTMALWLALAAVQTPAAVGRDDGQTHAGDRVLAGDDVTLTGTIDGDAFMAGGRSEVDGRVNGDAVLAGGTVEVRGRIEEGVYAAGGEVRLDATVGGDAFAAGGTVYVARGAVLEADARLAGGNVTVEGKVGDQLQVFAGRATLNGEVGGDVEVAAEDVRIGPDARIGGRVIYRSPRKPEVAPGAMIGGGLERARRGVDWFGPESGAGRVVAGVFRALWFAGVLLLGAVLVLALPVFTREAAATVRSEPLASIALGFATLVAVPMLAVLLIVTIVGIPLGFAVLLGYGLLLMLGYVTAALFVGDAALGRLRPAAAGESAWRILFLLGALVLIALLRRVPWVGDPAVFVLFMAGLGAFALRTFRGYRAPAPA